MKPHFYSKFVCINMVLLPLPLYHHFCTGSGFCPFSCSVDTKVKPARAW